MVQIPEYVLRLERYKAGKSIDELKREKGLTNVIKLASNENPLGPSPKAVEAIRRVAGEVHRYCDPASTELVTAIARKYSIQPKNIVCGHGTDALLAYIIMAFSEQGDRLVAPDGSFIGIYVSSNKLGRVLKRVPLKEYALDLDSLLQAITKDTRIVFLPNPNNPTGTMFTAEEFEAFMEKVPAETLVVLDEAYYTYVSNDPTYPDGVRYWYDNLVVTRTLSKAYGLAGLRIGFAVGPERVISAIKQVRHPFEPNSLALAAAEAALDDDDFLRRTNEANARSLAAMVATFEELGIRYVPSRTNFLLMLMPSEEFAATFYENCLERGLIVRHVKSFGVPRGVRVSSGSEEETALALQIITAVWNDMTARLREPYDMPEGATDETRIIQNSQA